LSNKGIKNLRILREIAMREAYYLHGPYDRMVLSYSKATDKKNQVNGRYSFKYS